MPIIIKVVVKLNLKKNSKNKVVGSKMKLAMP